MNKVKKFWCVRNHFDIFFCLVFRSKKKAFEYFDSLPSDRGFFVVRTNVCVEDL